jgi:hypothetical protein
LRYLNGKYNDINKTVIDLIDDAFEKTESVIGEAEIFLLKK